MNIFKKLSCLSFILINFPVEPVASENYSTFLTNEMEFSSKSDDIIYSKKLKKTDIFFLEKEAVILANRTNITQLRKKHLNSVDEKKEPEEQLRSTLEIYKSNSHKLDIVKLECFIIGCKKGLQ